METYKYGIIKLSHRQFQDKFNAAAARKLSIFKIIF